MTALEKQAVIRKEEAGCMGARIGSVRVHAYGNSLRAYRSSILAICRREERTGLERARAEELAKRTEFRIKRGAK